MNHFGKALRRIREAKNISGYAIEKKTGYSRSNLSNVEAGRVPPSQDLLEKLASIPELGVSLTELRALKAMDELSPEVLEKAQEMMAQYTKEELHTLYEQAKINREAAGK